MLRALRLNPRRNPNFNWVRSANSGALVLEQPLDIPGLDVKVHSLISFLTGTGIVMSVDFIFLRNQKFLERREAINRGIEKIVWRGRHQAIDLLSNYLSYPGQEREIYRSNTYYGSADRDAIARGEELAKKEADALIDKVIDVLRSA